LFEEELLVYGHNVAFEWSFVVTVMEECSCAECVLETGEVG
jgi:hypothetical protein